MLALVDQKARAAVAADAQQALLFRARHGLADVARDELTSLEPAGLVVTAFGYRRSSLGRHGRQAIGIVNDPDTAGEV